MATISNTIRLTGTLGNNPEPRVSENGVMSCTAAFGVWGEKRAPDGTRSESQEWFKLLLIGAVAERFAVEGQRGNRYFVIGSLQTRSQHVTRDTYRTVIEVVVDDFTSLSPADTRVTRDIGGVDGTGSQ